MPYILLALLMAASALVGLVTAMAQGDAESAVRTATNGAGAVFHIDPGIVALMGMVLTIGGTAVGWGLAMGKVRAHCEDESRHMTIQALDQRYYSKGEIDHTLEAAMAKLGEVLSNKLYELRGGRDGRR